MKKVPRSADGVVGDIELNLALTEAEWAEVANALLTKIEAVATGRYDTPGEHKAWLQQLRAAYNKLTKRLKAAGVPW